MALVSMTGFGRGVASAKGVRVEVELSSVNRKQFDLHLSLPKSLAAHESRIHEVLHKSIPRGALSGSVHVTLSGQAVERCARVDEDLARAYVKLLSHTASRLGLKNDLTARSLAALPEVVRFEGLERDIEHIWPLAEKALKTALRQILQMKVREGRTLERDLRKRLVRLGRVSAEIGSLAPRVSRNYRESLLKRLHDAGIGVVGDDPHVLKELAVFAERCDISEELVRLGSHFSQADQLMRGKEPAGRALDFLCQEMLREINTIGSKANDAAISRRVIEFKAALESLREQVQNVE